MSDCITKEPNCKCSTCHLEFYKEKRSIRKGTKHFFCSVECHGKFKSNQSYLEMCERVGDDFKTWLNHKYHIEKLNSKEMAELAYGKRKNSPNITRWMKRLDIQTRSISESVSMSWINDVKRKKEQALLAVEIMGAGTPSRNKLMLTMQTPEYKSKISKSNSGENNGMWNPDLTDDEREKRNYHARHYPGYQSFRKGVYERDDYTCRICGDNSGGNLIVHHLDGFHWALDSRTEVDNGVTLCGMCHKSFHSTYGVRNNTKEQFKQYLNKALVK